MSFHGKSKALKYVREHLEELGDWLFLRKGKGEENGVYSVYRQT